MIVYLRCLETRRRRAVYIYSRVGFSCSRPLRGTTLRGRVRDRVRKASESRWQQSSRDGWRDPATATASCWLQRTTANAFETRVAHAVLPGKCKAQAACFLLVSYRR